MKYLLLLITSLSLVAGDFGTLRLEEELRITPADGNDDHLWSGTEVFVSADHRGHMFVTDPSGHRIIEFDPAGKTVKIHGGQGQGPGEFEMLMRYQNLNQGGVAFDRLKLSFFDKEMNYTDSVGLMGYKGIFRFLTFRDAGDLFLGEVITEDGAEGTLTLEVGLYDRKLEQRMSLHKGLIRNPVISGTVDDAGISGVIQILGGFVEQGMKTSYAAFLADGGVLTGKADQYTLTRYDAQQKKIGEYTIKSPRPMRSDEELEALADAMLTTLEVPQVREMLSVAQVKKVLQDKGAEMAPVINGLVALDDGGFLVVTQLNARDGSARASVFDKQGNYRGDFLHGNWGLIGRHRVFGANHPTMEFRNGKAYSIELVDEEYQLVRYRVLRN